MLAFIIETLQIQFIFLLENFKIILLKHFTSKNITSYYSVEKLSHYVTLWKQSVHVFFSLYIFVYLFHQKNRKVDLRKMEFIVSQFECRHLSRWNFIWNIYFRKMSNHLVMVVFSISIFAEAFNLQLLITFTFKFKAFLILFL